MQVRLQNQGGGNLMATDNWRLIDAFLLNRAEFYTSHIIPSYCFSRDLCMHMSHHLRTIYVSRLKGIRAPLLSKPTMHENTLETK